MSSSDSHSSRPIGDSDGSRRGSRAKHRLATPKKAASGIAILALVAGLMTTGATLFIDGAASAPAVAAPSDGAPSDQSDATEQAPFETPEASPESEPKQEAPGTEIVEVPTEAESTADPVESKSDTEQTDASEPTEEPAPVEGSIGILSTSPGMSAIRQPNTFYAYVGAGENLDIFFDKVQSVGGAKAVTITVRGPGEVTRTCVRQPGDPVGSACSWPDLTSGTPGVWQIDFAVPAPTADRYNWTINVQNGATTIPGRAYTTRHTITQQGNEISDISLWYQNEQGYAYRADYADYMGVDSTFRSDATGVALLDTCVSAYESMDMGGPYSDTARLWTPPAGECGDPYKIFFEAPSASLPATAQLWNGTTEWLKPPVVLPTLSGLAFTRTGPTTTAGQFAFEVADFIGQLEILIDANNDGDYTDSIDRTVPAAVTADGTVTVDFDGIDGLGNAISPSQAIGARVAITQAGEIHFTNGDVETRASLRVEALNGPEAGSTDLYWNDTALRVADRVCAIPVVDGRAGVPSSAGVHGWPCPPGAPSNANNGINGSWGDSRYIDDWTFHSINEFEEIDIAGEPLPPFGCAANAPGLLFQNEAGVTSARLYSVDLVTGGYPTPEVAEGWVLNGVGYNTADDFVYGWGQNTGADVTMQLVRVGADGAVQPLGIPAGADATITGAAAVGDVDDDNHYWTYDVSTGAWWEIDLATNTVVDSGISTTPGLGSGVDWAHIPGTDKLWRVVRDASQTAAYLIGFDRTTHEWTTPVALGDMGGPGSANSTGAVFADSDGFLYASFNSTGEIWRVDTVAGTAAWFADGPAAAGNDGARCADSPILLDFGDAPDGYDTLLGSNGPRHGIPGYDGAAGSAPLMLGSSIDPETDGQPGGAADGDGADEDGVANPIVVTVGEQTTVSVSATNSTTAGATLAGWIDLDGNGIFDAGELVTAAVPAGSGTANYELAFPVGSVTTDTFARFRMFPADVTTFAPTGPAAAGEVEDYAVTVQEFELSIEKTSDATADTRPGDTVTYTVTATNTGTGDYTDENPAVVLDDLGGVLDDGAYNGDAEASVGSEPSFASPLISWSGALDEGDSVTITYTVTIAGGGDGIVRNVAFVPPCDPADAQCDPVTPACDPPVDGVDPATGIPCAVTELLLPRLSHTKVSDTTELPADGGVVTYTIRVTNPGPGIFTDDAPGSVSDNLAAVLDDATYNDDVSATTGTATFDAGGESIAWSGALGVGETATITYTVTYDSTSGDNRLVNVACIPAALAQNAADPCRSVQIPGSALQQRKSVDPASGTAVVAGQAVTYTLYFENTGEADASVGTFDDLSRVLDDATLTGGPTSSDAALTATLNGDRIDIAGTVPVGATFTVSYEVTVNSFGEQGDHVLANVLGGDEGCLDVDPTCRTENPVKHLTVTKTSDAAADVNTGDTVTYTVTVANDGLGDYTAESPAIALDDLAGVLDDAGYNDDASASAGAVSYTEPTLTWTGALAAGAIESFTYTVTVTNAGDHSLENVAGPVCAEPEICDPPVAVITPLPHVVPAKSSDPASGVALNAGDVVTYTLSFTNDGQAAGPVDSTDDLSGVLDDADVTVEPVASDPAVTAVRNDDEIRSTGIIQPGQTVTVTYQVTIKPNGDRGDNVTRNVLTPDVPACLDEAVCPPPTTEHPLGELDDWKTVDPASGSTAQPGQVLTYTLHFENIGEADVPVDADDVLSKVLDDATLTATAVSSDAALTVSALNGDRFTVTGTLAPGQLVTVSYTVTVNPDGQRGDDSIANYLVASGEEPPAGCVPGYGEQPDCTVNHVSNVVASKSADPKSGSDVAPGRQVTYTLAFENVSTNPYASDAAIDFTDHLAGVLDDATLSGGPLSSSAGVTATVAGDAMRVAGTVASGDTVTVSYTVTVKAYERQGDHRLGNVIAVTGEAPICAEGSKLCTTHRLVSSPPPLAITGQEIAWTAALAGVVLLLAGGGAVFIARRRAAARV